MSGCVQLDRNVWVCGVGEEYLRRHILTCPVEGRRRRHVIAYPSSPWYPPTVRCCGCGDAWSGDGELLERPFRPRWREEAIRKHKAMWDRATSGPPPSLRELAPEMFDDDAEVTP